MKPMSLLFRPNQRFRGKVPRFRWSDRRRGNDEDIHQCEQHYAAMAVRSAMTANGIIRSF